MLSCLFISSVWALEVPVTKPQQGFDSIRMRIGGFVQPRFTHSPDDDSVGTVGEVGFSVRRVRLEQYVDMINQRSFAIQSKVSLFVIKYWL